MNNNYTFEANSEYTFDDILDEEFYDYLLEIEGYEPDEQLYDNRYWKSYVEDIDGGDNFIDYCTYFFSILEEEGYYD